MATKKPDPHVGGSIDDLIERKKAQSPTFAALYEEELNKRIIARRIRELWEKRGLSQEELATLVEDQVAGHRPARERQGGRVSNKLYSRARATPGRSSQQGYWRRLLNLDMSIELDRLKREFPARAVEAPVVPDAFQRWMAEHRDEVAQHRGRYIALHAERGILVSAGNYTELVEELERQGVPDDQVVIEFIPPTPFVKK